MFRIAAQYVIFSGLFTAYLSEILPVQARIGKITFLCTLVIVTGLALSLRLLLLRFHERLLRVHFQKEAQTVFSLPFRELCFDVVLWVLLGSVLGILTGGAWWATWKTAVQLFCSSLMIGLVIGAFNFLHMQRALIFFLREHDGSIAVPQPEIKMSVASRITLLLYSIMAVSALFIGFLVFDEASAIVGNVNLPRSRVYRMILEIGAVVSAMIIVSIRITSLFTTNLNLILELQTDVLARVQEGTYDTAVPVVTRDEFGIIASRTNEMIAGLRDREHIRDIFGRYMSKEVRDLILSTGAPNTASISSPMNCSTRPWCFSMA